MARKTKNSAGTTASEPAPGDAEIKKRGAQFDHDGTARDSKRPRIAEKTDFTRWRMRDDESRQTWHYLEDDEAAKRWPQTYADKYYLGLPLVKPPTLTNGSSALTLTDAS